MSTKITWKHSHTTIAWKSVIRPGEKYEFSVHFVLIDYYLLSVDVVSICFVIIVKLFVNHNEF